MKILIAHNNYGKYSGEEAVVDKMAAMLQDHGQHVGFFRMTSEGSRESLSGKIKGFLSGIYSPTGVRGMRDAIRREKPDIINVHNLYPFISPAALFECKKAGIPVVMTVHNFRLICPTGLFMRNGRPCELCLQKGSEWSCIRYNCEHSLLKSTGYTLRNAYARWTGAYKKCVSAFACITEFQRKKLIEAGYDERRIVVIPNFLDNLATPDFREGSYVAYSGRLSSEKGIDLIMEVARRHPEIPFKFAGEARDPEILKNIPSNCELLGYLSGAALKEFYRNAAFFVMASKWYEGFPMSILEAAQYGKCVIGPDHGGFTEIIGKGEDAIGLLFSPGDTVDLEQKITQLYNNHQEIKLLGRKAFNKLTEEYSSNVIYNKWQKLFLKIK